MISKKSNADFTELVQIFSSSKLSCGNISLIIIGEINQSKYFKESLIKSLENVNIILTTNLLEAMKFSEQQILLVSNSIEKKESILKIQKN